MKIITPPYFTFWHFTRILALCLTLGLAGKMHATPKKILFYGPTHQSGGAGELLINSNPTEFLPIGQGSAIWSGPQWASATLAQFQAFDAIIIGDPSFGLINPIVWKEAIANNALWSAAISGNNILLYGEDPQLHVVNGTPGATEIIEQGIRFAAAHLAAGPGLFVIFSTMHPELPSPIDSSKGCTAHLLSGLGVFNVIAGHHEIVRKLGSHPATDCTTEDELSNWTASSHSGFKNWPVNQGWVPLAMVTDVPANHRTDSALLPPGEVGLVHLLAKSSAIKQFRLTPPLGGLLLGQQHTVTAKYLDASGQAISGASVVFDIKDGPNVAQGPVTVPTDTSGVATWTYTGNGGSGRDAIEATVNDPNTVCDPSARVFCDWSDQVVTITASDPNATEPAFQGGPANTGSYVISRTGNTAGSLDVAFGFGGTAVVGGDYDLSPNLPNGFTFNPGQLSQSVTLTPHWDGQSEPVESAVVSILPILTYAVGVPSEATVSITSTEPPPSVFWQVIGSATVNESGAQTATVRLSRNNTFSAIEVRLDFSGTASFAADYTVANSPLLQPGPRVRMESGVSEVDLVLVPVPDTRDEGLSETVVLTILTPPDSSYNVGSPAQATLTITDDDVTSLPVSGWKLTVVGSGYGGVDEGMGLNNVGQVVGITGLGYACLPDYPYQGYEYCFSQLSGFVWNNGNLDYLPPWYWSYAEDNSSTARAINNDGIAVGRWLGHTGSHPGDPGWVAPSFWWYPYFDWNTVYMNTLPSLPFGTATLQDAATDINDSGIIIGQVGAPFVPGNVHATAWIPQGYGIYPSASDLSDIRDGFSGNSYATAINNLGVVVGASEHANGSGFHAFRSRVQGGIPIPLSFTEDDMGTATSNDADQSEARDINGINELVGASWTLSGQYRAMYKTPGSGKHQGWVDLGVLQQPCPGNWSRANGINNLGLIVGQSTAWLPGYGGVGCVSLVNRAFVVSNQGNAGTQPMLNLTDLTYVFQNGQWYSSASQGWAIINAERINDSNWIVATAVNGGTQYAVLLTPR